MDSHNPSAEDNEFYFESDHLALQNNKDYRQMLRHIVSLECLKVMLIKDIERLHSCQRNALEDPAKFVEDLRSGSVEFPCAHTIPETPTIDWSQYGTSKEAALRPIKERTSDSEQEGGSNVLIRGRMYDETKPQTFNQLWTCEEQKRLEELLQQYPEEEVEMRRWSKIAEALGNRTPKQVMSRVQKYFLKLQRAGLPVPGRLRRGVVAKKPQISRAKYLQKRSTFFPAHQVPVLMGQEEDQESCNGYDVSRTWTVAELMRAVYERKKIEEMSTEPLPIHTGISCCSCKCENIVGTRWIDGVGSDWCSDCLVERQPSTRLTPIVTASVRDFS